MAEGKDIKIGIKTTADTAGAKAAEESLKKVEAAADGAGNQLGGAAGGVAGKAAKANKELRETAKAADAATGSSRAMRAGMQNLSYQAADVAVQLEMGTSAARVFTQQGSQMLAVLGPWGAVAGAALAIGGALFTASQNSGDAAESVTEDAEAMSEGMKALKQFTDDAAEALQMERLGASNEAFAARIKAIDELNKRLSEQLAIARQLRDIELQKQDAVSAVQIAEIEASDIPKEEQARKVAAIRAEMEQRARQRELDIIREREVNAAKDVEAEKGKEAAAAANFAAYKENLARNEKAVQDAEAAFSKAPDEIERLKAELEELKIREAKIRLAYGSEGGGEAGIAAREKIAGEEFGLKSDIMLQSPQELAKVLEEAAKYRDAAKEEFKAAEAAMKEAQKGVAAATSKASDVGRMGGAQRDLINIQGRSASQISEIQRASEERSAAQRKERERIEAQREAQRDSASRSTSEAGIGRQALSLLPKNVTEKFRKAVTAAAEGLQDGDQGGEIKELTELMQRLAAAVQVRGTKTAVDLKNLESRIKQLENK